MVVLRHESERRDISPGTRESGLAPFVDRFSPTGSLRLSAFDGCNTPVIGDNRRSWSPDPLTGSRLVGHDSTERAAKLKERSGAKTALSNMNESLGNYVRTHRRKSWLSQSDLGRVVGYHDEAAVGRHEKSQSLPPLVIAISYEIIFRVPVSELFAGLRDAVGPGVEERLGELEEELGRRSAHGPHAILTARKLEWLSERRASIESRQ